MLILCICTNVPAEFLPFHIRVLIFFLEKGAVRQTREYEGGYAQGICLLLLQWCGPTTVDPETMFKEFSQRHSLLCFVCEIGHLHTICTVINYHFPPLFTAFPAFPRFPRLFPAFPRFPPLFPLLPLLHTVNVIRRGVEMES